MFNRTMRGRVTHGALKLAAKKKTGTRLFSTHFKITSAHLKEVCPSTSARYAQRTNILFIKLNTQGFGLHNLEQKLYVGLVQPLGQWICHHNVIRTPPKTAVCDHERLPHEVLCLELPDEGYRGVISASVIARSFRNAVYIISEDHHSIFANTLSFLPVVETYLMSAGSKFASASFLNTHAAVIRRLRCCLSWSELQLTVNQRARVRFVHFCQTT